MPDLHTRIQRLEQAFGDPRNPGNPCGFQALLQADEAGHLPEAAERVAHALNIPAEFVPVTFGGRLERWQDLAQLMRAVFRRDPCLGLSLAASSLIASVNVWTSGSDPQKHLVADTLLSGRKLGCLYHELAHGNDVSRSECRADLEEWTLSGSKQVIASLNRAEVLLVFARTSEAQGSRSHTPLLLPLQDLPESTLHRHGRYLTSGMRGIELGGLDFTRTPVLPQHLVGQPGTGIETALKSFQVTRTLLPALFVGVLDTGLRLTCDFALERRLYGKTVMDQPLTRNLLAEVYLDLLWCDAFTTVTTRALQVLPEQCSLFSAATKALVPGVLTRAMFKLTRILGASFYTREGPYAMLQKLWRDLKPVGFGHASRLTCLMALLPQLPTLARRGWTQPGVHPELFQLRISPQGLPFDRLKVGASGQDDLISLLETPLTFSDPDLQKQVGFFQEAFRALREQCLQLHPQDLGGVTSATPYLLAEQYSVLLAASSCIQLSLHNPSHPLLGESWLSLMLQRVQGEFQKRHLHLSEAQTQQVFEHLMQNHESSRTFDLTQIHLPHRTPQMEATP
ncbi:acyl-CoA dehydrogenase [Deinococcus cellulosilyticus]|uniref:Putative acyl-CoA dehydrogenase n=1 Tax=Deinococcus cellulosilyticus (strain DSM 18568 / NBRC 106333 / KACC 11606 / 5516J-15) TaxID=1223518 RepID=A0A511N202_DEIC1|nr:acyl-CoA dehydrogenase [Deinococcus cellulosilyticus]GEM46880.1 putative acyl-CoA dehydrogenase [Deinococcus cellulosilyticus NBRC 106333 = KACC 11606]